MTAALAEQLATANAHMGRVREEYARTKADHELEDGCDDCARGLEFASSAGWEFDPIANILLCPRCLSELIRFEATMTVANDRHQGLCSKGLHDMGDEANHYHTRNGSGRTVLRCRECYRTLNRVRKARARDERRAAKAAARG